MPNHIANLITGHSLDAIREVLHSDAQAVDFNRLISRPKLLNHIIASSVPMYCVNPEEQDYRKEIRRPITDAEKAQLKALGCESWYDWDIKHWGTKWNAYGVEDRPHGGLYFETAWSMPLPILHALIGRLPDAEFAWSYADEDYGHNLGIWTYAHGHLTFSPPSALDVEAWAMRLHGKDDAAIAEYRAEIAQMGE